MANTIRIKRSTGSTAPGTLANAELAFTEATKILYIGTGISTGVTAAQIHAIGGIGAFVSLGTDNQTIAGIKTFTGATVLGTPGSGILSNCTGLSLTAGVTGILPVVNGGTGSSSGVPLATGVSGVLPVANGGTGFSTLASAGIALRGANTDITSLGGLTTALTVAQGGTGVTTSTGTGSTVLSASPTLTGTANVAALTSSGNVIVGGTLTLSGAPSSDLQAATKGYVDATATGLDVKASCRVASTANIVLATGGLLTIDGVVTVAGDRVLVKNQSTASQNGIYVVAAGAWSRSTDADTSAEVTAGMFTFISEGTANADSGWVLTTNDVIVLGTTDLGFAQFSGAGAIVAGAGLTKTGTTVDVVTANAARIVVNADSIDLATVSVTPDTGTPGISHLQSVTVDAYGRVTETMTANVRAATTSVTGIVQLSDSTATTSSVLAATPTAVKSAYDLANAALPKAGGTMTGKVTTGAGGATYASVLLGVSAADPTSPVSGDLWNNTGAIKFYNGSATKTVAFLDSTSTGTWNGAVIAGQYGGTGVANTGKTITLGGNLITSGNFVTTLTASGTTNLTLPLSGTLVTLDGAETLTQKTLTTPKIAQINDTNGLAVLKTAAIASAVNQVTITNNIATAAPHVSATGTDTNISLHLAPKGTGSYVVVEDGTVGSKQLAFGVAGATTSTTTFFNAAQTANRTITLPDATDTLVGKATTDILTNKSIAAASNTITGLTNTHLSGTAGITNANLANSAVTIGSTAVSLGATVSTFAGLTSVTSTGFTGALTGNASTATTLATTRGIYGNNFNGSADLTQVIAGTYGGTGVNNGANTITVAGNVSHAGSTFTQTFTATANTSVTLPTSGTLLSDGSTIDGGSYS